MTQKILNGIINISYKFGEDMEIFWIVIVFIVLLIVLSLFYVNYNIRVVHIKLTYRNLPAEFHDFRILLMSDLHDKRFGKENARLMYYVRELAPDMIAMAGDMHGIKNSNRAFLDMLEDIKRSNVPVFFVEGNHDIQPSHKFEYEMFMRTLSENGVTVLHKGQSFYIERLKKNITVSGIGWFDHKQEDVSFVKNEFQVFLKHNPLDFDNMKQLPDLMLCGHVHGGYIELPGIGAVFAPGDNVPIYKRFRKEFFRPKYYKGVYHRGECNMVVSRGLGNSVLPFRMMKPEITLITLKCNADKNMV